MGNEEKISAERNVLEAASSLLRDLYGHFVIDPEQTDRPDAAIDVSEPKKRIGIEITSVDDQKAKAYLNDEKFGKDITRQQLENFERDGSYTTAPRKKFDIDVHAKYIYRGAVKKLDDHKGYANTGTFDEVILLCYSDYITPRLSAKLGIVEWTNFFLSADDFPYDKVIYANVIDREAVVVYERSKPLKQKPLRYESATTTLIQGSFTPMGVEFNINNTANQAPLIKPKQDRKKGKK
ncbi:TPA: hypothetical protein SH377_003701 [Pseudomonas aeruginosa]|uniref:hypothetical protein n=1 Tax=Pseudomonas aeruginosa TaxID=287 RepID=UPI00053ED2A9|nr:hypothetical protein [Pseudomonas aeruginosa]MCO3803752.1 hypothetical protein [Pseudomonas aeruginosa]MDP5852898.1 hypothetical protein [Pseudomonas aeruginosa]PBV99511.1 hypothetical protein CJU20_17855 [Pseudomonas aeruginosa]RPT59393.1 hypothetical protein IPC965_05840 [Pseudomonas aeruginosa]HBO1015242.1 hypothetical protein [Pseudomonas aeruginosa]